MKTKELVDDLIKSVLQSVSEQIHEFEESQQELIFERDKDGDLVPRTENIEFGGRKTDIEIGGLFEPYSIKLKKAKVSLNTDMRAQGGFFKRLIAGMNLGKSEASNLKLELEFTHKDASVGMTAVHQALAREVKEALAYVFPGFKFDEDGNLKHKTEDVTIKKEEIE